MLIEGYMIKSYGDIDRPWRFEHHIENTVNHAYANSFMQRWRETFFTEKDVQWIAKNGFNMIRIAIDYQVFFEGSESIVELQVKEDNFKLMDDIIKACSKHHVYVMLDLHAAPGGQTGTNIDNSRNNHPELFDRCIYQDQTVYIWKTIANRYKDEPYIAAYDLLNEPLPEWFSQYNDMLMPFYERIIAAIREIDPNHMITLEGVHWSTDWSCFHHFKDNNILLQFHKYWNNPDQESIQKFLDDSSKYNLPIMMGEGGENNLAWYATAFKLYEQKSISYCFWTYKKMSADNSLISFDEPKQWQEFLSGKLNKTDSKIVLESLLDSIAWERCYTHEDVVNAIMNKNTFTCPGFNYDFYGEGSSFSVVEKHPSSFRINDGVHITNDKKQVVEPNFNHNKGQNPLDKDLLFVRLYPCEWVEYTFYVDENVHRVLVNIKADDVSSANIYLNKQAISHTQGSVILKNPKKINTLRIVAVNIIDIESINFQTDF